MFRTLACLAIGVLWASLSWTQTENASAMPYPPDESLGLPPAEVFRKDVHEVNLIFTAQDWRGRFRTDLSLDDLILQDNGLPPVKIERFEAQTQLPLRVVLLIDTSDSIIYKFKDEKAAALSFLEQVLRPDIDEVMIAGFGDTVQVVQQFTGDVSKLRSSIAGLEVSGATAFYDAISFAIAELNRHRTGPSRQVIIVISDGQENTSHISERDAISAVLRSNAVIFALSTQGDLISRPGYPIFEELGLRVLRKFANVTGGTVMSAGNRRGLNSAFAKIKEQLRSQYFLAYRPADFVADGRYRRIKLSGKGRRLRFYAREGYYTRRQY